MAAAHTGEANRGDPVSTAAASALGDVLDASLDYLNGKLAHWTERWVEKLDDYEAARGPAELAGYRAAKAGPLGRNRIWAAIKGGWAGASTHQKLAAVLLLVLVLLLAPVPTLLIILGVLIALLVNAIRAADR
jgi:hypothetical protein